MPKSKPPTYKYGSSTYNVLAYAYAYDKALTIDDFQELSNKAFTDKNVIKKALNVLEENKAMVRLNDTYWRITANGMKQALELAREHILRSLSQTLGDARHPSLEGVVVYRHEPQLTGV